MQSASAEKDDKSKALEDKFNKLKEVYQKLREEHISLLRQKADVDKKLSSADITKNDAVKSREMMEKKLEDVLTQITVMKETAAASEGEQSKQVHNLQATNISLSSKLTDMEEEVREMQEKMEMLEAQTESKDVELNQLRLAASSADQNKHNLEYEIVELTSENKTLQNTNDSNAALIQELKNDVAAKTAEADQRRVVGVGVVDGVKTVEDIESLTSSGYSLTDVCSRLSTVTSTNDPVLTAHLAALVWGLGRGVTNTCPDIDLGLQLTSSCELVLKEAREWLETPGCSDERLMQAVNQVNNLGQEVLRTLGKEADLADLVASEISAMDVAIEEAARKIEELLEASRQKDSGAKLEVNENVLDSCTALVKAIKELVNKSKALQKEIITERGVEVSEKEWYRMNSRWTDGLISAAKAVGLGAKLLVDAADRYKLNLTDQNNSDGGRELCRVPGRSVDIIYK